VLGYAAPELAAWVDANREAVLRAAEAVETAYVEAVDELASRLPGGVGAEWVTILDRQRMQTKTLGHPLQQRHIAQSLDVDPVHFRRIVFRHERVPV
jgi:hypothetical protein